MKNIYVDMRTLQTIPFMRHSGDFTYDMSGDEAVAQEDVPLIGTWTDWTGSGGTSTATQQQFASQENSIQGTIPDVVNNIKIPNLSVVGTRQQTHRRRVKREYVGN
jgi:hypothetical protein